RGGRARPLPCVQGRPPAELDGGRHLLQRSPHEEPASRMSERVSIVTGGAGFIGSHMVDLLLARGDRVRVIDNLVGGREANLAHHRGEPRLAFERRDIRELEPTDAVFRGADLVFHFAGIGDIVPSIERPTDYMDTNVQGTVRVLEGARTAK